LTAEKETRGYEGEGNIYKSFEKFEGSREWMRKEKRSSPNKGVNPGMKVLVWEGAMGEGGKSGGKKGNTPALSAAGGK